MDAKRQREGERLYRVAVDSDEPMECTESALMLAWRSSVPDLAMKVRALPVEGSVIIFRDPTVEVKRIA